MVQDYTTPKTRNSEKTRWFYLALIHGIQPASRYATLVVIFSGYQLVSNYRSSKAPYNIRSPKLKKTEKAICFKLNIKVSLGFYWCQGSLMIYLFNKFRMI